MLRPISHRERKKDWARREREKMLLAWLGDALCISDRISFMWFMAPRGWAEPGGWSLLSSKVLQFATVKRVSRLCLEEEKVSISTQERIASRGSSVPATEAITFLLGKQPFETYTNGQKFGIIWFFFFFLKKSLMLTKAAFMWSKTQ